jgi:hypothetical protein
VELPLLDPTREGGMAVSTIDGRIEEAVLKRAVKNLRIYERIKFRLPDGSEKSIAKAQVDAAVAEHLIPGSSGRFYLFTAFDHRGIHGFRDASGTAVCVYPQNNEKAALISGGVGLALFLVNLLARDAISFLGIGLMILGPVTYFIYRSTRVEATGQFEADSRFRPAGAEATAGA